MQLFINAGGQGKRLYPLTKDIPKPMIKIAGRPMLEHLVEWAKKNNIAEIIIMSGYKAQQIIQHFGDGSRFGIPILHSKEEKPLDSGGALKLAGKFVKGTFAYINGDQACEIELPAMLSFHKQHQADATLLLHHSTHPEDCDILEIDPIGRVKRFISKHEDHSGGGSLSNAGLCILEPKVLELMTQEVFNFENHLFPKMLKQGCKMMGYVSNELMQDLGTLERIQKYESYLKSKESKESKENKEHT